jgi:hypothetical protein
MACSPAPVQLAPNFGSTSMKSAAKIMSVDVHSIAAAGREKRAVTVRVRLGLPHETLRITVVVPDEGDDAVAREYGVARAKDLARQFGARP